MGIMLHVKNKEKLLIKFSHTKRKNIYRKERERELLIVSPRNDVSISSIAVILFVMIPYNN